VSSSQLLGRAQLAENRFPDSEPHLDADIGRTTSLSEFVMGLHVVTEPGVDARTVQEPRPQCLAFVDPSSSGKNTGEFDR